MEDCGDRNVIDYQYWADQSQPCAQMTSDYGDLIQDCSEAPTFDVFSAPSETKINFSFDNGNGGTEVQDVRADFTGGPIKYRLEVPPGTKEIRVLWPVTPDNSLGKQSFKIVLPAGDLSLLGEGLVGPLQIVSDIGYKGEELQE